MQAAVHQCNGSAIRCATIHYYYGPSVKDKPGADFLLTVGGGPTRKFSGPFSKESQGQLARVKLLRAPPPPEYTERYNFFANNLSGSSQLNLSASKYAIIRCYFYMAGQRCSAQLNRSQVRPL